jgi:16S rRNA (cytosine967-C5)-methyltransferase
MIKRPFREHHLLNFLDIYEKQQMPLDFVLNQYFRQHKSLGPKDRSYIAETIFTMIRWKGLLDYLSNEDVGSISWEERLRLFLITDLEAEKQNQEIPLNVRHSFPKELFDLIVKSHGQEKGCELCKICNQTAPLTVRVNLARTNREAMLKMWEKTYPITPCKLSETGILFQKRINLFQLPEFKAGMFEVQDEGSQLLCDMVKVNPGEQVMDYCAGSGGKTLGFAPRMQGKGQIYLHDVRKHALLEARRRLCRAGIQNAQIVTSDDDKLKKLKKKMDWVLVDAPCSGTGTLRRNPDMKWKFTEEMLKHLIGQQRVIFEKALSYLKPGGHIVYSTCSLLKEENEEQVEHFTKTYGLKVVEGSQFQSLPTEGGMDGFFGITFKGN